MRSMIYYYATLNRGTRAERLYRFTSLAAQQAWVREDPVAREAIASRAPLVRRWMNVKEPRSRCPA